MASITVQANQIGFIDSINASGDDDADVDISALFPAGSTIEVVFDDGDFDANGNLITDGDDVFIDLIITESNGNVIEVEKIKLDLAPERIGDAYISTADAVTFTDSDGNEFDSQIIVVTVGTLSVGENLIIPGDTNADNDTNFNLCFEGSTLIETPNGPKQARSIQAGDLVCVARGRIARVVWAVHKRHTIDHMKEGHLPILIKKGALGHQIPNADTIVSGQHRIMVGSGGQLQGLGLDTGIVAAKALTLLPGIRYARGKINIEWSNFAFERHDMVKANGAWMESLLFGPVAMDTFTTADQKAIRTLFQQPTTPDAPLNGPPAQKILKVGQVMQSLRKCRRRKQIA